MSADFFIRTDHGEGIAELSINRAPVNALSAELLMDLAELMQDMGRDNAVRGVVFTSPFKVFSAGLDLKEAQEFSLADQHAIVTGLNIGFPALFAFAKPTVVAVNGAAIAGGLFFVLACDYRIATPRAKFGLAEVRVGADFPVGPLEIARATLDPNTLRRLMLTGRPITATQALSCGLIDQIEQDDTVLVDRALRAVRDLAASPPETYSAVKQQIRKATLTRINDAIAGGANTPEGGWFSDSTKAAMKRMIG